MVENYKFKVGDKVYKPKGYKFPATVVSIFKTTSGDVRIVAEMLDNGMLHIFNENQLELDTKGDFLVSLTECQRVAQSMVKNTIENRNLTLIESKEKVLSIINNLMADETLPQFLVDYWGDIKNEVEKISINKYDVA